MVSKRTMSGGDGRTEPGFVFPVDAPKCCHHHVSRRRKEKTRDENQALYFTRGQLPADHTKRDELFHRLPAGGNKNQYSTRKYKLKFVAGWPTNKLTHKHKAKRKITRKRGVRACVCSLNRVEREVPFSVSVAPPFFSVSPTLLAALPDPAQRKPSCRS
jgi:hypothetical protein